MLPTLVSVSVAVLQHVATTTATLTPGAAKVTARLAAEPTTLSNNNTSFGSTRSSSFGGSFGGGSFGGGGGSFSGGGFGGGHSSAGGGGHFGGGRR